MHLVEASDQRGIAATIAGGLPLSTSPGVHICGPGTEDDVDPADDAPGDRVHATPRSQGLTMRRLPDERFGVPSPMGP